MEAPAIAPATARLCTSRANMTNWISCARLVVAVFSLTAASHPRADRLDDLWSKGREVLELAGITEAMFRSLTVWSEGQYYLGYCRNYLPEHDVAYWRNWWDKTVVPRSQAGAALLASAAETYQRGLNDGASQKPSQEFCRRTLDSWSSDMTAANEEARARP